MLTQTPLSFQPAKVGMQFSIFNALLLSYFPNHMSTYFSVIRSLNKCSDIEGLCFEQSLFIRNENGGVLECPEVNGPV